MYYGIYSFISRLHFQNNNSTDAHIGVLSGCALSSSPPDNRNNHKIIVMSGLRSIIRQNKSLLSDKLIKSVASGTLSKFKRTLLTDPYAQSELINLIAMTHDNSGTVIGPITTKLLNTFLRLGVCEIKYRETALQLLGLSKNGAKVISTEGYDCLDVNSPLFNPPKNIFYGLEVDGLGDTTEDLEISEVDEGELDDDEDGSKKVDPKKNQGVDPKKNQKVDPNEEKPPIKVAVPTKSVLLQTRNTATDQLEEYLYLVEVYNLIRNVLEDNSIKLTEEDTRILSILSTEFLFTLTPASIESIVSSVIKVVPKIEK